MSPRDSIHRRLLRVIVVTTGLSLGIACAVFIFLEWRNTLAAEKAAALSTVRITREASSAMLAFGSREEARKLLGAFRAEPNVRCAALYGEDGKLFAEYRSSDAKSPTPATAGPEGLVVNGPVLEIFQAVTESGKRFGTLYLRTDLRPVYDRMARFAGIAVLIFAGSMAGAYFIGRVLQRTISQPILSLAETAQSVARDHDYSVRAERGGGGELEILTTAFNQMLNTIHEQQAQLRVELKERERAQLAEARERQLLATTLASIGDAVIATNALGEVTFLNGEAERLTGWRNEEAAGKALPEVFLIVDEKTRQPVENPVAKVLKQGSVVGLANHTILIARNGRETPIDDSAAPIREPGGPLFGVVLVFRDFTERKAFEQALQRSEEQVRQQFIELEAIYRTAPLGLCVLDREMRFRRINERLAQINGVTVGEHLGRTVQEVLPSLIQQAEKVFRHVLDTGQAMRFELRGKTQAPSQEERIWDEIWYPLRDVQGAITGVGVVVDEITERKRIEQTVQELLARMDSLVTYAPIGIALFDLNLRYLSVNDRTVEVDGISKEDHIGKTVAELIPGLGAYVDELLRKVRDTGEPITGLEIVGETPAAPGKKRHWIASYYPVRTVSKEVLGIGAIALEVTEQKRAEEALKEAHEQLASRALQLETLVQQRTARLNEMVGDLEAFSYSLVHDMRGPLRAMQSFAHLLAQECGPISPMAESLVQRIKTAAQRMDRLIQDGFNYSRLMRADLPLVAIDVAALVRGMIETYPAFQEPHADVQIEGEIPAVLANEAVLTQCFSNLLGNAVKFVPPDTEPKVRIRGEAIESRVRIFIQDNGIGIEPDMTGKIFQIFQRLDTTYEGTGIGLAIVKKSAERMGGTVGVESTPGKGSTFWLDFAAAERIDNVSARESRPGEE